MNYTEVLYKKYKEEMKYLIDFPIMDSKLFEKYLLKKLKDMKHIMEYLQANNFKEKQQDNVISCFEHQYEKNNRTYMDVYIHVDCATKGDAYSQLN